MCIKTINSNSQPLLVSTAVPITNNPVTQVARQALDQGRTYQWDKSVKKEIVLLSPSNSPASSISPVDSDSEIDDDFKFNIFRQWLNWRVGRNLNDSFSLLDFGHTLKSHINYYLNKSENEYINSDEFQKCIEFKPTFKQLYNCNMKIAINDTTEYTKNKKLKVYINLFFNKKIDNFIDSEVYEDFIGTFPTINELINFNEQRSITDPIPVEDYKKYTGEENTTTNTKEIINRHLKHNSNEWILMEEFKISLGYYDHKHWLNCNLNRPLEHFISAEEFRTHFMTKLTYAKLFNLNVCKPLKSPIKDVYLKPKYHPAWNFCMGRDPDHPISAAEIKQYKETNAWNQKISMTSNPDKNLTQLKPRPAPDYNR